jgi:hypothetical protein
MTLSEKGNGKLKRIDLEIVTFDPNPVIMEKKKANFTEKLDQLQEMGLIVEEGEYLIGIPHLFYHQRKKL